jgi:S1-C subfamily serine protease
MPTRQPVTRILFLLRSFFPHSSRFPLSTPAASPERIALWKEATVNHRMRQGALALVLCILAPVCAPGQLKDYIVVVKPVLHPKTRENFLSLSTYFEGAGYTDVAQWFRGYAQELGHGTGWVYVDEDGENYIITNRHVVNQAGSVNVYLEKTDGTKRSYTSCPILYVDNRMDLAVVQFPGQERPYRSGLQVDTKVQPDLARVVSAGFPGFGSTPLWQIAPGNITNSQAKLDEVYKYLIQHSAPIDPGNSGGPLLIEDARAPLGYRVIGVNTWKAKQRESTNFAIPAADVMTVLARAREARTVGREPAIRLQALTDSCKRLAAELNSDFPDYQLVNEFISYAIVGEQGYGGYQQVVQATSGGDRQEWQEYFVDDPVEAMRSSIYWLVWYSLYDDSGKKAPVSYQGINYSDEQQFATLEKVRTTFKFGQDEREIIWTREYGQWRVTNLKLPQVVKAKKSSGSPETTMRHTVVLEVGGGEEVMLFGASYHYSILDFLRVTGCFVYDFLDGGWEATAGATVIALPWLDVGVRVGYGSIWDDWDEVLEGAFVVNPLLLFWIGRINIGIQVLYPIETDGLGASLGIGISF